jgi:predicted CopG family antitoxin
MGSMGNLKLIAVTPENYWHLKNLGKAGDSFNDVITILLKEGRHKNYAKSKNEEVKSGAGFQANPHKNSSTTSTNQRWTC